MRTYSTSFFSLLRLILTVISTFGFVIPQVLAVQVINDDLVVTGSACIGSGVCSGAALGTSLTLRGLEGIEFGTRWRVSSSFANGLYIVDLKNSRVPLFFEQDAPADSIYLTGAGNVGLGTATPVFKLHLVNGDTPTVRLEQNNGGGNTPYTWDVGGNEINFFITDATGGGNRPFLIRPGAPESSIDISATGKVGLGTPTPQGNLHIFGAANQDVFSGVGPNLITGPALNFGYAGFSFGRGAGFFNVRPDAQATAPNPSLRFATVNVQRMIITNTGQVGIGTLAPTQQLDVTGNIRASGGFISGGTTLNVPDYVFELDYKLMALKDLQTYLTREKHLPDMPTAQEIRANGINIGGLQMQLLKKIEELTLYTLEQERINKAQEQTIAGQAATVQELKEIVVDLTDRLAVIEKKQRR